MSTSEPPGPRVATVRELGGAVLIYALLTSLATWPLLLHFGDHVPGADGWRSIWILPESLMNMWNLWWFRYSLLELGQNPFDCRYLFYPYGADLWFHTLAPLHGVVAIVLQTFVSLTITQNLLIFASLIAAGVCSFALALQLGLGRAGALVAGAIYAFSPAVLGHLHAGHYELITHFWLPALLLAFTKLTDVAAPRPRDGIALGLLFAASAYSSQYYCVYGLELLALAALTRFRRTLRPATLRSLGVAAGLALLGWAPLLWTYLGADASRLVPGVAGYSDFDHHSGDLVNFFVPAFTHPVFAEPLGALHEHLNPLGFLPHETTTYVGWVVLALGGVGAVAMRRAHGGPVQLLLAIALVFSVLSLGSHLRVAGTQTGIALPGFLFEQIPLLRLARAPGRHAVVAMLGFALLAGFGWERLRQRWLAWTALALLAFEFAALPLPLISTALGPVYRRLAEVPGDFAVLEIPLSVRDGHSFVGVLDNRQILAQSVHRHPIVSGMSSRLSEETWRALLGAPVIGTLLRTDLVSAEVLRRDRAEGPAYLARVGIQAVVLQASLRGTDWERYADSVLPIRSREEFPDGTQLLWLVDR